MKRNRRKQLALERGEGWKGGRSIWERPRPQWRLDQVSGAYSRSSLATFLGGRTGYYLFLFSIMYALGSELGGSFGDRLLGKVGIGAHRGLGYDTHTRKQYTIPNVYL